MRRSRVQSPPGPISFCLFLGPKPNPFPYFIQNTSALLPLLCTCHCSTFGSRLANKGVELLLPCLGFSQYMQAVFLYNVWTSLLFGFLKEPFFPV